MTNKHAGENRLQYLAADSDMDTHTDPPEFAVLSYNGVALFLVIEKLLLQVKSGVAEFSRTLLWGDANNANDTSTADNYERILCVSLRLYRRHLSFVNTDARCRRPSCPGG